MISTSGCDSTYTLALNRVEGDALLTLSVYARGVEAASAPELASELGPQCCCLSFTTVRCWVC